MNRNTIVLAFTNLKGDRPLDFISQEREIIPKIFEDEPEENRPQILHLDNANTSEFHKTIDAYKDHIVVFHYGGHANGQAIQLGDGQGYKEGLAKILGRLKKLKLVFLNGCATEDQVKILLKEGVKAIIATRVEIDDEAAFYFSKVFYEKFAKGATLRECFEVASSFVKLKFQYAQNARVIKHSSHQMNSSISIAADMEWVLFYQNEEALLARGINVELSKFFANSNLINKVKALDKKLKIKILIAGSSPQTRGDGAIGALNVNNEIAQVKDYLVKLFKYSNISQQLIGNVYEYQGVNSVPFIHESSLEAAEATVALPSLSSFDLIVWIVWHNLGQYHLNNISPLEQLYKEVIDLPESNRPQIQIYRRGEPILSDYSSKYAENQLKYEAVDAFFKKLSKARYVDYHPDFFEDNFEHNVNNWLQKFVANQTNNTAAIEGPNQERNNPYMGLKPYDLVDSPLFFGRNNEIDTLLNLIETGTQRGLLAVIGASGSGKSSLVKAGLFNRFQLNAIPNSASWQIIEGRVQQNRSFHFKVVRNPSPLIEQLNQLNLNASDEAFRGELAQILNELESRKDKVILYLDQFEEVFSILQDEKSKEDKKADHFVQFLVAFAGTRYGQVILTMRSEYFHHCLQFPALAQLIDLGNFIALPPDAENIAKIISRPAEFAGLTFEDDLMTIIQNDAGKAGDILPLLSYVLKELVEKSKSSLLTKAHYNALGGVTGIIQKQAKEAISSFEYDSSAFLDDFSFVFRKLVVIGNDGLVAKRVALFEREHWPLNALKLVDALIAKKLLGSDLNVDRKPTLSITHEALFRNWDYLKNWIEEYKAYLSLMTQVEQDAKKWADSRPDHDERAQLEHDLKHIWKHERLVPVYEALNILGHSNEELDELYPNTREFIRLESERLVEEIALDFIDHERRAKIGDRLADLKDPRPGVGLNKDGLPDIDWVSIPAGSISLQLNGSEEHFELSSFQIARYPITLGQFNAFAQNPELYHQPQWWSGLPVHSKNENHNKLRPQTSKGYYNRPAQEVNWYQAVAFCRWMSAALGFTVRLPTEWEWQYAASGGNVDYVYPWGKEFKDLCSNHRDAVGHLVAVGLYPSGETPQGLMDMAGNIVEWCYNVAEDIRSTDLSPDVKRVTKGGGWMAFQGDPVTSQKITGRWADRPNGKNDRGDFIKSSFRIIKMS